MKLRDYQQRASDKVFEKWQDNVSTLVVMPTGTGKTVLFADIIRRMGKRAIVVAHRKELIYQACDKIERVTGLDCAIEMGDLSTRNGFKLPVVVSSVQTQISGEADDKRRMHQFDPYDFGVLIMDEAHHSISPSCKKVINHYRRNPDLRVLGVTATPKRADEEALGQVFTSVAFEYLLLDAIKDGWLVPIHQQMVHIHGLDFSHVKTTAGDLNGGDLARVMEAEEPLQGVAGASIDIIGDGRAIVFTSSVPHAEMLCEIFNRHRYGMADWVCGETDTETRANTIKKFKEGTTQVICNYGVLTEGYDDAGVEYIIMGRPTKSRTLYEQMMGRGTRPLEGVVDGPETPDARRAAIAASAKPYCRIVDLVGNSAHHKIVTSADVLGGNYSAEVVDLAVRNVKKAGVSVCVSMALEDAEEELRRRKEEAEERKRRDAARRSKLVARVSYTTTDVNPFDIFGFQPVKAKAWNRGKVLSERQANVLRKIGVDPGKVSYDEGLKMIRFQIDRWNKNLCTANQAKLLRKFGYDATNMKMKDATQLITQIKENGWRRPAPSTNGHTQSDRVTEPEWNPTL